VGGERAGPDSNLVLFALTLSFVVLLVLLQRSVLWLLARLSRAR
jgi:hypothetical protein